MRHQNWCGPFHREPLMYVQAKTESHRERNKFVFFSFAPIVRLQFALCLIFLLGVCAFSASAFPSNQCQKINSTLYACRHFHLFVRLNCNCTINSAPVFVSSWMFANEWEKSINTHTLLVCVILIKKSSNNNKNGSSTAKCRTPTTSSNERNKKFT